MSELRLSPESEAESHIARESGSTRRAAALNIAARLVATLFRDKR